MARIGILTCSNCTQELNCASAVCLGDMRKKKGFFDRYQDQEVTLMGMISCAGCPTSAAPEKILRRVRALIDFKIDALHLSYCITALCPFMKKYIEVIKKEYPEIEIIEGTHKPLEKSVFGNAVKELICSRRRDMNDYILAR
ncbi:MAG TPA: CGGC domain-containing protein [Nitrospirota bacterium]|nr:CGGC domain-containing protein [Syntrophales bacterium]HUL00484.1 CGGC domain-containing protein [Nitrospirota bacterium]